MANKYVRNTTGANANDGSTWALANLDLGGTNGAATDAAAGDTIYVSQVHAESSGAPIVTLAGTPAAPVRVICVNDSAEPPTTAASSATLTSTSNFTVNGSGYFWGLTFRPGSGGSVTQSFLTGTAGASTNQVYDNCSIQLLTTGTGLAKISFGDETRTDSNRYVLNNTTFKLPGVNFRIRVNGNFRVYGGSFLSGSASLVNVFETGLRGIGEWDVSGLDLSANIGTAFNLILQNSGGNALKAKFKNLKLPSGWTGGLWSATPTGPGIRAEMYNSFAGAVKYRVWTWDYAGQVRDNTVVVRTGGAADDGVSFSLKMTSTADAEFPVIPLESTPIRTYVDSTTSTTISMEIVHDSQGSGTASALRNDEFGIKVVYPGGSSDTFKADIMTAPTDLTSSSETWTTTGLVTPVKQKVSITFTPTSKGEVIITPILFAASKTVYICPKLGA
jgi:hypothetical protein